MSRVIGRLSLLSGPSGAVNSGQLRTDQVLECPAWHPEHVAEVDHGQTGPTVGFPPLSRHGVRLGAPDPQQGAGFLDGQQSWNRFI